MGCGFRRSGVIKGPRKEVWSAELISMGKKDLPRPLLILSLLVSFFTTSLTSSLSCLHTRVQTTENHTVPFLSLPPFLSPHQHCLQGPPLLGAAPSGSHVPFLSLPHYGHRKLLVAKEVFFDATVIFLLLSHWISLGSLAQLTLSCDRHDVDVPDSSPN